MMNQSMPGFKGEVFFLSFVLIMCCSHATYADDATVLPKGVARFLQDWRFVGNFNERFDEDGNLEKLGDPFSLALDSNLFSALAPLNAFVPGNASLGNSEVSIDRDVTEVTFQLAYGVTNKLSLGVNIPYLWVTQNVRANVNSSTANVGKNSAFACGSALCPLVVPGTVPLSTADVQNVLGGGLDVDGNGSVDVPGQGLEEVEDWSGQGFGDIEFGARYQYYKSQIFRGAFTGAVRVPTGREDDPDNLIDVGWGRGTYAFLFQLQQDLVFQQTSTLSSSLGFPLPGDFYVNTTFKYDLNLPDSQNLRICDPSVCTTTSDVNRRVGDIFTAEINPRVGLLTPGLNVSVLYRYLHRFKDHYSGCDAGLNCGVLNEEFSRRGSREHFVIVGLQYSTIPLFIEKKFPFPASIQVSYRDRFAGKNALSSQWVGLNLQVFIS